MREYRRTLQAGIASSDRDPVYLAWVRTLGCCVCGMRMDVQAHHRYGQGWVKGAGTKVPDYWTIPLCATHHNALHQGPLAWEDRHGSQWMWIALTLQRAIAEGVLDKVSSVV